MNAKSANPFECTLLKLLLRVHELSLHTISLYYYIAIDLSRNNCMGMLDIYTDIFDSYVGLLLLYKDYFSVNNM